MHKGNLVLFSPGLGYINRGIETFTRELYEVIVRHQDLQVTLFQGTGEKIPGGIQCWAPHRNDRFYDLPLLNRFKHRSFWTESVIFSIPLALHCYTQPCHIVHFNEGIPANVLYHLRKRLGGSFKLLFCNGGPLLPQHYQRYDYAQLLTPDQREEALAAGLPADRLFMVPYGINSPLFYPDLTNQEVQDWKHQWQLPKDRVIILSAGAINTGHKRMDWMIKEFSELNPERFFLWMIGQQEAETPQILNLAATLLKPGSYKVDTIPYALMPYAYRMADYFVLCSLTEGLPKVYLEAMSAKLPMIVNRSTLTEWVLGADNLGLVDMTKPNQVKDKILEFSANRQVAYQQAERNQRNVLDRYDWKSLYGEYLAMYEQIIRQSA